MNDDSDSTRYPAFDDIIRRTIEGAVGDRCGVVRSRHLPDIFEAVAVELLTVDEDVDQPSRVARDRDHIRTQM